MLCGADRTDNIAPSVMQSTNCSPISPDAPNERVKKKGFVAARIHEHSITTFYDIVVSQFVLCVGDNDGDERTPETRSVLNRLEKGVEV